MSWQDVLTDLTGADTASQAYRERGMLEKARMAELKEANAKKITPGQHAVIRRMHARENAMDSSAWGILICTAVAAFGIAVIAYKKTK